MARAYYNEFDPKKAAWLRELIKEGVIANGEVDERSIESVQPGDLAGFTQCHFFGGIGVWSYALRLAGWSDSEPCWTGSCPCQPFSAAGKKKATQDKRHLWPAWFRLIEERRPRVLFAEQVASRGGLAWLDIVRSDLEKKAYTSGTLDLCSAGFGAPHIRQRLYLVAHREYERCKFGSTAHNYNGSDASGNHIDGCSEAGKLAHSEYTARRAEYEEYGNAYGRNGSGRSGTTGELGNANGEGLQGYGRSEQLSDSEGREDSRGHVGNPNDLPGPTNGFWADAQWVWCRDGKWRPTEPGTFPLASGTAARILKLRGYGDAICAPVAAYFIRAYMEAKET